MGRRTTRKKCIVVAGDIKVEASSLREATPNVHTNILEQLLPTLVAMEQTQKQTLQFLMKSHAKDIKEPSLVGEPIVDDPLQSLMHASNTDNHSAAGRQRASMGEEPTAFMTRDEVNGEEGEGCIENYPRSAASLSS